MVQITDIIRGKARGSFAARSYRHAPREWRLFGELRQELSRRQYFITSTIAFAFFLLIWSLLTYGICPAFDRQTGHWHCICISDIYLPFLRSPTSVLGSLINLFIYHSFVQDIKASIFRVCGGFAIACLVAIPLGVLAGSYRRIDALISPFAAFMRYMPATAFIPLLILWFQLGDSPKMALVFLGTFWYVLILVTDATATVQISYLEAAYTLGASQWQTLTRVVLPAAAPEILNSMKAMVGAAWTYLIAAELICKDTGISMVIDTDAHYQKFAGMWAAIITVGIIGILTNVLFEFLNILIFPWKRTHKAAGGV